MNVAYKSSLLRLLYMIVAYQCRKDSKAVVRLESEADAVWAAGSLYWPQSSLQGSLKPFRHTNDYQCILYNVGK